MTDWRPEIIKFVMYPTMYPTLAPCVQTRRTIRSIRSRHSTHFCHSTQYSRLCSTFFNLEHVCSVINTSTWWPRKRKRSKSFLGVHVQKERSVRTNRFVPRRWTDAGCGPQLAVYGSYNMTRKSSTCQNNW